MTNAKAQLNKSLRPRKPEGSLGRTAQDVHLDSHTAPELWCLWVIGVQYLFVETDTAQIPPNTHTHTHPRCIQYPLLLLLPAVLSTSFRLKITILSAAASRAHY